MATLDAETDPLLRPTCPTCRYNLAGLVYLEDARCPECGAPATADHLRRVHQQRLEHKEYVSGEIRKGVTALAAIGAVATAFLPVLAAPDPGVLVYSLLAGLLALIVWQSVATDGPESPDSGAPGANGAVAAEARSERRLALARGLLLLLLVANVLTISDALIPFAIRLLAIWGLALLAVRALGRRSGLFALIALIPWWLTVRWLGSALRWAFEIRIDLALPVAALLAAPIALIFIQRAWRASRACTVLLLTGPLGVPLLLLGLEWLTVGLAGLARGEHWSWYDVPWPTDRRPVAMSNHELVELGRALVVGGAVLTAGAIVAAVLAIRTAVRRGTP